MLGLFNLIAFGSTDATEVVVYIIEEQTICRFFGLFLVTVAKDAYWDTTFTRTTMQPLNRVTYNLLSSRAFRLTHAKASLSVTTGYNGIIPQRLHLVTPFVVPALTESQTPSLPQPYRVSTPPHSAPQQALPKHCTSYAKLLARVMIYLHASQHPLHAPQNTCLVALEDDVSVRIALCLGRLLEI